MTYSLNLDSVLSTPAVTPSAGITWLCYRLLLLLLSPVITYRPQFILSEFGSKIKCLHCMLSVLLCAKGSASFCWSNLIDSLFMSILMYYLIYWLFLHSFGWNSPPVFQGAVIHGKCCYLPPRCCATGRVWIFQTPFLFSAQKAVSGTLTQLLKCIISSN